MIHAKQTLNKNIVYVLWVLQANSQKKTQPNPKAQRQSNNKGINTIRKTNWLAWQPVILKKSCINLLNRPQAVLTSRTCANVMFNAISFGIELQLLPPPFHFWLLRKLNHPLAINYCNFVRIHHIKNYWNESKSNANHTDFISACKKEYILMRHLYQPYWEIWYIHMLQMKVHKGSTLRQITTKNWTLKSTKPSSVKQCDQNVWVLLTRKSAQVQKFDDGKKKKLISYRRK